MQYSFALAALFSATVVVAAPLPLNINLGAYSPALVVGDGEISFGGEGAGAKSVMETLSGAGVSGPGAAKALLDGPPATNPGGSSVSINQPTLSDGLGLGRVVRPRGGATKEEAVDEVKAEVGVPVTVSKRDINGFNAALSYALGAVKVTPEVQLGTGDKGAGVGILVKPGITAAVAAGPARAGGAPAPAPAAPKPEK